MSEQARIETLEIDLLLEAVWQRYGYDFRHYARSSLKRRLAHRLSQANLTHFSEMIPKILYDREFFNHMLLDLSVTVTEMFRDPQFFLALRKQVVPRLKTYPFVKIWHAGCATGEEVYSMAILLQEEGLYDRVRIYATDYNNQALHTAREGVYPLSAVEKGTANYTAAGGRGCFGSYYHAQYDSAKLSKSLKHNIVFSHHNLVSDGVFGEMQLIVCKNVLIYFDKTLQDSVLSLFGASLCNLGFLCLGTRESLEFSAVADRFEEVCSKEKIYRYQTRTPRSVGAGGTV